LPLQPRPELENLVPSLHGGPDTAELKSFGLTPDDIIDFSVCSNPFAPPPEVMKAADRIEINRYPDSESTEFRECLADSLGIPADNILAGSGAMEIIRLVALAYFSPGDTVLILEPTFGEYRVSCRIMGAEIISQWSKEEDGYSHRIVETVDLIRANRPKGVFICNPNNPTGKYLGREEIESVADAGEETLIILDEAYVNFASNIWRSLDLIERKNLVIIRSMTKDHAMTGLRLGYAVAHREIIDTLRLVRPPWNINAIAQEAGKLIINGGDYLAHSRRELEKTKQFLLDGLKRLGYSTVPSDTHFFLVMVGNTAELRTALLKQRILVRDCSSFGLPGYIRIAARTMPECEKLIEAIEKMGSEKDAG
jgi:histidinol-phosphate aminotransferase